MFQLTHLEQDCTGRWQRLERDDGVVTWCCSGCGARYADGTAVRFAVLREYDLELVVSRLMREGRQLLSRRNPKPRGPALSGDEEGP